MLSDAMTPEPKDSPLMKAWEAYKVTDDYANTRKWAYYNNGEHVDGSLWASFSEGFRAALAEQAEARVAELEKDAKRYRWLLEGPRQLLITNDNYELGPTYFSVSNEFGDSICGYSFDENSNIDAAIDAAMKGQEHE